MSELKGLMDDFNDEDIRAAFNTYLATPQPSPGFEERLNRLILDEVQRVYAPAAAMPMPAAPAQRAAHPADFVERIRVWLRNLSPRQTLVLAGASAIVALLAVFFVSQLIPQPLTAPATVAGGDVTILHRQNSIYRTYQDGDTFRVGSGDQILTADGTIFIQLFPLQTAEVAPHSHVVINQLDAVLDSTQVELLVKRGRVNNVIDEVLTAGDRYVVTSSLVHASAVGTEFSFETLSPSEVIVITRKGAVEVSRENEVVIVEAGQQVTTFAGAPLIVQPSQERSERPTLLVIAPGTPGIPVYTAPNAGSSVVGYAEDNMLLQILNWDASREWYQVCCVGGQVGWLRIDSVTPTEPESAIENETAGNGSSTGRNAPGVTANVDPMLLFNMVIGAFLPLNRVEDVTPVVSPTTTPTTTLNISLGRETGTPQTTLMPLSKASPTPTLATMTPTRTLTPRPTNTPTSTSTATPSNTPSPAPPTNTFTPTPTHTPTPVPPTPTNTPTPVPPTPTNTPTPVPPTPTNTPTPVPPTPTNTPTPVPPTPTNTPTPVPPTPTNTPTPVPPTPTNTPTPVPPTPTNTPTPVPPTPTNTFTPSPTPTHTFTPSPTPTNTPTPVPPTPTNTFTPSPTPTHTFTPSPTPTNTPTPVPPTPTHTFTPSPTPTPTNTESTIPGGDGTPETITPTAMTETPTNTPVPPTPTNTPTPVPPTPTNTPTPVPPTPTDTPTPVPPTPTNTPTPVPPTPTNTPTPVPPTPTNTPTPVPPTPTDTPTPVPPTPTNTPTPVPPTPTNTPTPVPPTPTSTPVPPTPTNTPTPPPTRIPPSKTLVPTAIPTATLDPGQWTPIIGPTPTSQPEAAIQQLRWASNVSVRTGITYAALSPL